MEAHRSSLANTSASACADEPAAEVGGAVEDMLTLLCCNIEYSSQIQSRISVVLFMALYVSTCKVT
jgi:hypothetical protein